MTRLTQGLSFDDAVAVWLHRWNGKLQHEIAALFGVNQGRVNEVLKERKHVGSQSVAASKRSAA